MGTENFIVREYLESLKEDGELDKIFPLLLTLMQFKIVATPKESKGQPQYGKDIVAIGFDRGVKKRYYFELKGHADKDIDDSVFTKTDGIRESLIAAKDLDFSDNSIPGFNALPSKIVLVHNGIVKSNTRPIFDSFVSRTFERDQFERWGIEELSEMFSRYLFSEYLMTDKESVTLLKKTLVLLDVPEYDLREFKILVTRLLNNDVNVKTRRFIKCFATLNLLAHIIFHYSRETNNLLPAKNGIDFLVLQTWAWILNNKIDNKKAVLRKFRVLLAIQYELYAEYFEKTFAAASARDGLFAESGGPFEHIGYPLRAMIYISDLIYYFHLRHHWPNFDGRVDRNKKIILEKLQKKVLFNLIYNNDGCKRPIIDAHSIPILMVFLFVFESEYRTRDETLLLGDFVINVLNNIVLIHSQRGRYPELTNNIEALIQYSASGERPFNYEDSSSMLLLILIELVTILDKEEEYQACRENFNNEIDLQTAYPPVDTESELEPLYFSGNIYNIMYVESSVQLPEKFAEFKKYIKDQMGSDCLTRTKAAGFPFLHFLSSMYFRNDIFPSYWRKHV